MDEQYQEVPPAQDSAPQPEPEDVALLRSFFENRTEKKGFNPENNPVSKAAAIRKTWSGGEKIAKEVTASSDETKTNARASLFSDQDRLQELSTAVAHLQGQRDGYKTAAESLGKEAQATKYENVIEREANSHLGDEIGVARKNEYAAIGTAKAAQAEHSQLQASIPQISSQSYAKGQADLGVDLITNAAAQQKLDAMAAQQKDLEIQQDREDRFKAASERLEKAAMQEQATWSDAFSKQTGAEATLMFTRALIGVWKRDPTAVVDAFENFATRKAAELNKNRESSIKGAQINLEKETALGEMQQSSTERQLKYKTAVNNAVIAQGEAMKGKLNNEKDKAYIDQILSATRENNASTALKMFELNEKQQDYQTAAQTMATNGKDVQGVLTKPLAAVINEIWNDKKLDVITKRQYAAAATALATLDKDVDSIMGGYRSAAKSQYNNVIMSNGLTRGLARGVQGVWEGRNASQMAAREGAKVLDKWKIKIAGATTKADFDVAFAPTVANENDMSNTILDKIPDAVNKGVGLLPIAAMEARGWASSAKAQQMIDAKLGARSSFSGQGVSMGRK